MKRLNQTGSHVVALAIGVLVVTVIGFAGYHVLKTSQQNKASTASSGQAAAPVKIQNKADLTQATKTLDTSSTQLDGSLNDNSLNADLNSLL